MNHAPSADDFLSNSSLVYDINQTQFSYTNSTNNNEGMLFLDLSTPSQQYQNEGNHHLRSISSLSSLSSCSSTQCSLITPSSSNSNQQTGSEVKNELLHDDTFKIWTLEEDIILCDLQRRFGNDWALIAKELSNRTRIEVKTRHRSISRAAKKYWTEDQDIILLQAFVGFNCTWNDAIHQLFPSRTKNSIKLHIQELLKNTSSQKEITPLGSSTQVIAHRPDLVTPMFSSMVPLTMNELLGIAEKNANNAQDEDDVEEDNDDEEYESKMLVTPSSRSLRLQDSETSYSDQDIGIMNASPTSSKKKRMDVQSVDELVKETQAEKKQKRNNPARRLKTLNALMNRTWSQQQILPRCQSQGSNTTSKIASITNGQLNEWNQSPSIQHTLIDTNDINDDDLENLINILS